MNIFLISRGFPTDKDPSFGNFEIIQAEALRKLGHKVTILAPEVGIRTFKGKVGMTPRREYGGYSYQTFPVVLLRYFPSLRERSIRKAMKSFYREVAAREGKPDLVYAHYLFNMNYSLSFADEFDGALVGIEHWSRLMNGNIDDDTRQLVLKTYPKFDKIIAVSPALSRSLKSDYGIKASFVPNIVDSRFIDAPKTEHPHKPFKFSTVARLVGWKNIDIVVEACGILRDREVEFNLNIAGAGEEYDNLARQIENLHLGSQVRLAGILEASQVVKLLSESDALVLPSSHETFGVVFIEAMAMGLPVIAGNFGGPVDIVNESNGILVPIRDAKVLADSMQDMIENYSRYDNRRIALDCESQYSSEKVAKSLEKIFEETLAVKTRK